MVSASHMQIDLQSRTVVLRTTALGQETAWEGTSELVGRLLSAPCVESILIDRTQSMATLRLTPTEPDRPATVEGCSSELRTIAACLRQSTVPQRLISDAYAQCPRLQLQKHETGITAGVVFHALPGRVRLRHPLLRKNPDLALRVESAIGSTSGVNSVATSTTTGSILILFQPDATTPAKLLGKLERIVSGLDDCESLLAGPPMSYWLSATTCLGLAVATEFFTPGLGPATALALVGFNLPTLTRGLSELLTFQWRVSALYTVIMGTTLASGQFLAAALMQASVTTWHCWSSYRLRQVVRELTLAQESPERLLNDAGTAADFEPRFAPGMIVNVPAGVALPFDGIVVAGEGEFDEHRVRGIAGIAHRTTGEHVFAGSVLTSGQLKVEVVAVDASTRLAAIRRTVRSVIGQMAGQGGPTLRGKALASRFVPFTFATGTAAFLIGGLPTLAAVLRPDFATGPSLTERFGTLSSVSNLLHEGWLVNNPVILQELGRIKTIVIARVNHPGPHADTRPEPHIIRTKIAVGLRHVDVHEVDGTEAECLEYIRHLDSPNRRIAVVASHHILSQFTENEVLRISFTPEDGVGPQHADLIALHAEPQRLKSLLCVLHETSAPSRNAWAVVLACNSLAISGAFLIGLTSLHVVVLTNIGALAAGAMYGRHTQHASRLLCSRKVRGLPPDHEILLPAPEADADLKSAEPRECSVDETTGPPIPPDDASDVEKAKPGSRRNAARHNARLQHDAVKLMVLANTSLNENRSS